MARYNEILVGRYNRFLQKLLSMKGPPPAPQLSSEIGVFFQLFNGRENRYLEGWNMFGIGVGTGTPAAGNRAAVRLRNPAGSNVVAVIEKMNCFTSTGADNPALFYNSIATTMPTESASGNGVGTDVRGGVANSTAIWSASINFGLQGSPNIGQIALPANTTFEWIVTDIQELVLAPGSQYTLTATNLTSALSVNFWWRERFLEDSERA